MKKLITLNELDQYLNQEDLAENQESAEFEEESIQENPKPLDRTNSTYNIISKVAYLIGVEKSILKMSMSLLKWKSMRSLTKMYRHKSSETFVCCVHPLN